MGDHGDPAQPQGQAGVADAVDHRDGLATEPPAPATAGITIAALVSAANATPDMTPDMTPDVAPGGPSDGPSKGAAATLDIGDIGDDALLREIEDGVGMFLSNRIREAQAIGEARAATSPYHALSLGTILTVQAVMTMTTEDGAKALQALDRTILIASRYRRRSSILEMMSNLFTDNGGLGSLTANELHAELIWAEAVLLQAAVQIMLEQSFLLLVRSAVSVRTAYKTFRALHGFSETAKKMVSQAREDKKMDAIPPVVLAAAGAHFSSGVALGVGGFDIILSLAPASIVPVMQLFGFSGSRVRGLALLTAGATDGGVQSRICELVILLYRLILIGLLAIRDSPLQDSEAILAKNLEIAPRGALYLYFRGKLDQTLHRREEAVDAFTTSLDLELPWTQLHHICYWELIWTNASLLQWEKAADYAGLMLRDNKWSPATYAYLQGAMLVMLGRNKEAAEIFKKLPPLKQKILGKSLPPEKFVLRKGRKFLMQSEYLLLPAFEIMYTFGQLPLLGPVGAEAAMALIMPELVRLSHEVKPLLQKNGPTTPERGQPHKMDDYALALILATNMEHLRREPNLDMAVTYLRELFAIERRLTLDHYLAPFGHAEMAKVHMLREQWELARKELAYLKANFRHYSNEPQLQMRLHIMAQELDERERAARGATTAAPAPAKA